MFENNRMKIYNGMIQGMKVLVINLREQLTGFFLRI